MSAAELCLLAAGAFFLTGLLTGTWKYAATMRSDDARAPAYVDIAHRASLLYSFACILLREFVPYSPVGHAGTLWAVGVPIAFFASAVVTYLVHGMLRDTDNQLRRPHVLGRTTLPGVVVRTYMTALAVGEIGGFAVLFWGLVRTVG